MDLQPQPQTTFIPKKPVVTTPAYGTAAPGIFMIVAVFIFGASIIAAVGVFGYTRYLNYKITVAKGSLAAAREAFDPASIEELVKLDTRLREAQTLLRSHIAPSAILDLLEKYTLTTIRYNKFEYVRDDSNAITLKLDGQAADFGSLALQSDTFAAEARSINNVAISDVDTDQSSGLIKFSLSANIDPVFMLYRADAGSQSASSTYSMPTQQNASSTVVQNPGP